MNDGCSGDQLLLKKREQGQVVFDILTMFVQTTIETPTLL